MRYSISSIVRRLRFSVVLFLFCLPVALPAQTKVELFCGADLSYADVNFIRLYDVLLNLTPGVKWHLGHDWMLSGQAFVPVINDGYGKHYSMVRANMAVVSKELHLHAARQYFKFSAGFFGKERCGFDLRWMYPICDWLMLTARADVTRHWAFGFGWDGAYESYMDGKWIATAQAGASFYIGKYNTEFRLTGGRYMNEDMGVQLDVMRHFRHCTVGVFGQLHERGNDMYTYQREAGGFKVVMMLPPYRKSNRKVVFRPASNFRLTYNAQSDGVSMKNFFTDPEENERQNAIQVPWGTGKMEGGEP